MSLSPQVLLDLSTELAQNVLQRGGGRGKDTYIQPHMSHMQVMLEVCVMQEAAQSATVIVHCTSSSVAVTCWWRRESMSLGDSSWADHRMTAAQSRTAENIYWKGWEGEGEEMCGGEGMGMGGERRGVT